MILTVIALPQLLEAFQEKREHVSNFLKNELTLRMKSVKLFLVPEDKHESNRISQPHHGTLTRGKATEEVRAWARRTHGTPGAAYSGRSVSPLAAVGGNPWD